jgi:hypothetical protein
VASAQTKGSQASHRRGHLHTEVTATSQSHGNPRVASSGQRSAALKHAINNNPKARKGRCDQGNAWRHRSSSGVFWLMVSQNRGDALPPPNQNLWAKRPFSLQPCNEPGASTAEH